MDKPWYQSRTIWATLVGIALETAQMLGYQVSSDIVPDQIAGHLANVGVAVAFGVALYGRFRARHRLTK